MKNKLFIGTAVALLVLLYSFTTALKVDYKGDPFTSVKLKISANVIVNQGNSYDVKIEAPGEVVDEIITEVNNETLTIKYKSLNSWRKIRKLIPNGGIKIYIKMKDVEGLAVSGSGDIRADGAIISDDLALKISGSGDIIIPKLEADKLSIGISGSGDVKIGSGSADKLAVSISGSGDINTSSLDIDEVSVKIAGSGNCKIGESDELRVSIAGSGDVIYRGDPDLVKKIAGSGNIRRVR